MDDEPFLEALRSINPVPSTTPLPQGALAGLHREAVGCQRASSRRGHIIHLCTTVVVGALVGVAVSHQLTDSTSKHIGQGGCRLTAGQQVSAPAGMTCDWSFGP